MKDFTLSKARFSGLSDVPFLGGNLYEIYKSIGGQQGIDYTSSNGNHILVDGRIDVEALKKTHVFLNGRDNFIHLTSLKGIFDLNVVCIKGSRVSLTSPMSIRGASVISSHGSRISISADCLMSTDVMIYASKAHGLYNVADGSRRSKDSIDIGKHVWLGRGVRILAGTDIREGSVIGSYSVLARKIPNNCAAAGNPCRVLTRDVFWTGKAAENDGNYLDMLHQTGTPVPYYVRQTTDEA